MSLKGYMEIVIYAHKAVRDFFDAEGYFHSKGSYCYVGSGSKNRSLQFTVMGGGRTSKHEKAREHLEVVILESVSVGDKIKREIFWYDALSNNPDNKLFNKSKPKQKRNLTWEFFNDLLFIDETSPSGLRWNNPKFLGANLNKENIAGSLVTKQKKSKVRLDYKFWRVFVSGSYYPAHCIVWLLHHKQDIPEDYVIMHLDNNPSNNLIENLCLGTQKQNRRSKQLSYRNKTGVDGVRHKKKDFCFRVQINGEGGEVLRKNFAYTSPDRKYAPKYSTIIFDNEKEAFIAACAWRYEQCKIFGYAVDWYENLNLILEETYG